MSPDPRTRDPLDQDRLDPAEALATLAADLRELLRAAAETGLEGLPAQAAPERPPTRPSERSAVRGSAPAADPERSRPAEPRPSPPERGAPPVSRPGPPGPSRPAPPSRSEPPSRGTAPPPPTGAAPQTAPQAPNAQWARLREASAAPQPPPISPASVPGLAATNDLDAVRAVLGDCRRCGLCERRRTIVFGVGDPDADLVICGEGPGEQEDLRGEPFVGPAGQMLDRMLENVLGLGRHQVYILNVVKCRPPDNRTPSPEEVEACRPFLEAQLRVLRPRVILALGRPAAQTLLGTTVGINALRGRWHAWREVPVMPTFHPAYLLRQPDDKRKTFEDLKLVAARYRELGGRA